MRQAVAVLMPLAGIDACRDADAVPARTCADADTDVAAFAAVFADGAFAVLRRLQVMSRAASSDRSLPAFSWLPVTTISPLCALWFLPLAVIDRFCPAVSVLPLRLAAVGAGFAFRRLAAVGGADTHRIGGALRCTFVSRLQSRQRRFSPPPRRSAHYPAPQACAACTPDSAALVFCSAVRRPSPSFAPAAPS